MRVAGWDVRPLDEGWEAAWSSPDAHADPSRLDELDWLPAHVPGTAAGALAVAGRWAPGDAHDFDAEDWWFRTRIDSGRAEPGEELVLRLDGLATVAEVFLDGERVLASSSMWAEHALDVGRRLTGSSELAICCRALAPLLRRPRRPRARWRTRVVSDGALRWYRTMLFGRSPGFAAGPAPVGPWRDVRLERRRGLVLDKLVLHPRLVDGVGVLRVHGRARALGDALPAYGELEVRGPSGTRCAPLVVSAGDVTGELRIPEADAWWPHTHGEPSLHDVMLRFGDVVVEAGRVGFRALESPGNLEEEGLDLRVNGVRVWARGAVWTPIDLVALAPAPGELRRILELVRDAGMNMLRVVGTGAYEPPEFHDLCDELGILVWQDLMFANLDYPTDDADFATEIEREARQVLAGLAGRPSLAVVCGNSEVEQQAAMLGLDPTAGRSKFFGEIVPRLVAESGADAIHVPSTPCGGALPFHPDRGVAHYFGVSGYFRPLADARRAAVRFAAECLAFANVPDEVDVPPHHPRWKLGVPRDAGTGWDLGAGWDFDDVRDYYLEQLFGLDPVQLRRSDLERYLELARQSSGEVMAEVMGEWRRAASPCRGALVLWLRDMLPGAGLGVLDHAGRPKVAYHHLRRALAPVAVWLTDEGLAGVRVHLVNDRDRAVTVRLCVSTFRDLEVSVGDAEENLVLGPHSMLERDVEGMLGRFVDAAWAYRFGPPTQDVVAASLWVDGVMVSEAFLFPGGRPAGREPAARLGLVGEAARNEDGNVLLGVSSRRLAYGVRVGAPGTVLEDDAFSVPPGGKRRLLLRIPPGRPLPGTVTLSALNASDRVVVAVGGT